MVWEPRTYRRTVDPKGLVTFEVALGETDLQISANEDLTALAVETVRAVRDDLERYIAAHPRFAESYAPLAVEPDAPAVVQAMARAGAAAGVGPMAAVAGAVAEVVARSLGTRSNEVIVENGGDLFLVGNTDRVVLLVAGDSALSGALAIDIASSRLPVAVCTSSGKVGHSVSLGSAHAVTVVAADGALADAVATAAGNLVHGAADIETALAFATGIDGVRGAVVISEDRIGAAGVRLVPVAKSGDRSG